MARPKGKRQQIDGELTVIGKAGNGTGSIYFVAERGIYKATYTDPATGKRRTVSAPTKGEVEARRSEKLAELEATVKSRVGPDATVADVAGWWLDNVAATQVRPSTLHAYKKDAARIVERIGSTPARDLDVETVRAFIAGMRRDNLAVGTVRNTRARLRQIAQTAVELGALVANPVPSVPLPREMAEERVTRRALTAEEVRRLLATLSPERRYDAAVALLFTSGLRVSEALGLAWSDIDLDAGTATIRRGCTYTGGGIGARLDKPKTTRTAGVHHLAPSAVALLRARRVAQAAERLAAGPAWETVTYEGQVLELVFTTPSGGLVARQHVAKALTAACERAGIHADRVATHTGRRSAITALFVAGVSLDDIARHVGHASTATSARYVQDLGDRPRETAEVAARLLDPAVDA